MASEIEKFDTLSSLGIELNQVNDLDILMEQILYKARLFVNADAGSIYIKKDNKLLFSYTQNDTLQKRLAEGEKLIFSTFEVPINDKSLSGYVALTGEVLNISDVYKIEESKPYHFSREYDDKSKYKTTSVLTIPLTTSAKGIVGILQIINPMDKNKNLIPFKESDEKMMHNFAAIAAVALERAQMTRGILLRMIRMAEMRDPKETGAHVNRVAGYSLELYELWAKKHDISNDEVERNRDSLRMAAMLHDVGKVAISDLILKKPGAFNENEYDIMKQHTLLGAQLFIDRQSSFDDAAQIVSMNHHERWDGKGYPGHIDISTGEPLKGFETSNGAPRGKKGDETHIYGRIVAIADVFDALSSARVYKKAWDEEKVLSIIKKESGGQFDPELVEMFLNNFNNFKLIQERYKD